MVVKRENPDFKFKVHVWKGCKNEKSILEDVETINSTYDSNRKCHTGPEINSSDNLKNMISTEQVEILSKFGLAVSNEDFQFLELNEQSESCFCYGLTEKEDPMAKYLRLVQEKMYE